MKGFEGVDKTNRAGHSRPAPIQNDLVINPLNFPLTGSDAQTD